MLSRESVAHPLSLPSRPDGANSGPLFTTCEEFRARMGDVVSGADRIMRELAIDNEFDRIMRLPSVMRSSLGRTAHMFGYVAAPVARVIETLRECPLGGDDVFCDIGAGICRVPMFVRCWTGCRTIGVDYDPALTRCATDSLATTGLDRVSVVCADARTVDYASANVFFMYQPFEGAVLDQVLGELEQVARQKPISVWWLGNHNGWPAKVSWLRWELDSLRRPWDRISVARSRDC